MVLQVKSVLLCFVYFCLYLLFIYPSVYLFLSLHPCISLYLPHIRPSCPVLISTFPLLSSLLLFPYIIFYFFPSHSLTSSLFLPYLPTVSHPLSSIPPPRPISSYPVSQSIHASSLWPQGISQWPLGANGWFIRQVHHRIIRVMELSNECKLVSAANKYAPETTDNTPSR